MIDNEELNAYLTRNGVTGPIIAKILQLKQMAESMCEEVEDYVLSEYLVSGRKEIDSIWFFSDVYSLETKDIRDSEYRIDLNYFSNYIEYHEIIYENIDPLDPQTVRPNSKIKIEFDTDVRSTIQASGQNCIDLIRIYRKYILPNSKFDR